MRKMTALGPLWDSIGLDSYEQVARSDHMSIITYKFRIKSGDRRLKRHAIACNQVWNYCVDVQRQAESKRRSGSNILWPSYIDFDELTRGVSKELELHSDTVKAVCRKFTQSRSQRKKCPSLRNSFGAKRKLGWIPFRDKSMKVGTSNLVYLKRTYTFWKSREIQGTIKT